MQRTNEKERWDFIRKLGEHCGNRDKLNLFDDIQPIAKRIMRYGATYGRIQELWCTEQMSDERTAYYQRKEQRIEQHVKELCATLGAEPVFSGDPRGNTIKLRVPDGYADDWGKTGICVPTS